MTHNGYKINICKYRNMGLCNQLYQLIAGIVTCINEKRNILMVGHFLMQVHTNKYCHLRDVISITNFNYYLKKYNLTIVDHNQEKYSDMQELHFEIDERIIELIHSDLGKNILQNIRFEPKLVIPVISFVNQQLQNNINRNINIIHLRTESDAIQHWSKQNNMSPAVFTKKLNDKYIKLIHNHIQKETITFVLSGDTQNKVIEYLQKNNYKYTFLRKNKHLYREIRAIMDMIIGKLCNSVFIGAGGSTFTQILLETIPNDGTKKICLNLNKINDI